MIRFNVKRGALAGCCAAMALTNLFEADAAADELVLVEDGESLAPVVAFQDAPPKTLRAAEELVDYIEKISGARPELIEGTPDPVPEHAIWVGYQPVLNELFPELDFDFQHPEEILIAANDSHLVIAGRDRWDPDNLVAEIPTPGGRRPHVVHGVQQEYGTCNAVYTFLQDFLDVRWLWPGELGEDVLRKDTLAFAPFEYRYHPQFRSRSAIFRLSQLVSWRGIAQEWTRFQRLQLDSSTGVMGHNFSHWWDRFGEVHPEYFAFQPDGTRGWPHGRTSKLCKSNPAVWDQWLEDVEELIEQNPVQNVFMTRPNDGAYSGYCVCPDCLAWDHPDLEKVRYSWEGLTQEYVAQSNRLITFINTVARMLRERFPDREYYVLTSTYGNAHPVPVGVVPDDNVIVEIVAHIHNRPFEEDERRGRQNIVEWAQSGAKQIRWRGNMGGAAGWQLGFPNVAPRRVIDDMRFAAENNVMAVAFDTMWEHWVNQGPHYYMLAQMAWNPYADGEQILADYYQRVFGPAAESMTAYWELMDETSEQIIFTDKTIDEVWPGSSDAEFYQRAYGLLDGAVETLGGADEIYRERVAYVRAGLDYLRFYRENQHLIERLEENGGEDADALATARENWKRILEIHERYPHAFSDYIRPREDGRGILEEVNPDRYGRAW